MFLYRVVVVAAAPAADDKSTRSICWLLSCSGNAVAVLLPPILFFPTPSDLVMRVCVYMCVCSLIRIDWQKKNNTKRVGAGTGEMRCDGGDAVAAAVVVASKR